MTLPFTTSTNRLAPSLRGVLVLFVIAGYLLSGILHVVHDLDLAKAAAQYEVGAVSASSDASKHTESGAAAGHHCHGCFSVSVPWPPVAEVAAVLPQDVLGHPEAFLVGTVRGLDPPPPKA